MKQLIGLAVVGFGIYMWISIKNQKPVVPYTESNCASRGGKPMYYAPSSNYGPSLVHPKIYSTCITGKILPGFKF